MVNAFALTSVFDVIPFSILEAMAVGLPVVETDVGGVREMVQEDQTGFVVTSGDSAALAQAIERLVDNGQLRSRFGAAGGCLVEIAFSEHTMLRQTMTVYAELSRNGR